LLFFFVDYLAHVSDTLYNEKLIASFRVREEIGYFVLRLS
jgi:hypothetical protein